jgi:alpha/beta superfamily hydrolase
MYSKEGIVFLHLEQGIKMTSNQVLHVTIPTSIGSLEGILKPEDEGSRPTYVGLVCHLHPLYGGTMHNKVVFQVARALQEQNIPALRFNFRGVGHSSGVYDEGRGEMDDVRFALEFLSRRYPGTPAIIAGFSFGSWVGLRVGAVDDRVQALIGLGTPARMFAEDTLQGCHKPKLFVHGTADEQAAYELTQAWFETIPAPKQLVSIQGANHFFQGRLGEVQNLVMDFVRSLEGQRPA